MGLEDRDWYRDDYKRRQGIQERSTRRPSRPQPWRSDYPRGVHRLPWFLFGALVGAVALECFKRFA
jgi:hypothetical protein